MADMFAVQLAQLARKQGDNSNTTFAQEQMPARTKATNDLKMLAKNGNVSIPTALDREHEQKLELLRHLSGDQFNKAFLNDEVQSTWDEIYLADVYAKKGNNADLKNWASTNLPKLKDQLNKAEKLS
jgi:putative membrane protein